MPTMIKQTCAFCQRDFNVEIKRINAGQGTHCSKSCAGKAKYKGGRKVTCKRYRDKHKKEHLAYNLEYNREYRKTIRGYLVLLFHRMKERCKNPEHHSYKWYGGCGIKCLFKNTDEFVNYVINKLKVDPRGLDCDRINNNGHYKPGNIQFITHKENLRKIGQ